MGLFSAGFAAWFVVNRQVEVRIQNSLAQEIEEFARLARDGVDPETGEPFRDAAALVTLSMQRNVRDEHETHLAFLPDTTIVPVDGEGILHQDPAFRTVATRHLEPGFGNYLSPDHGLVRYAVMPVTQPGGRSHFVVGYFADREYAEVASTVRAYALAGTSAWTVLVLATWALTRRILRPVENLRATAESITESDLTTRIPVRGKDELAELGVTVNRMLDRLQDALDSQRRMLDDAGHELRTPITVIRGHLELMDPGDPGETNATRDLAIEELDRMGDLVGDLILLAKSRRHDFLRLDQLDLADVVRRALEKATALAPRAWVLDHTTSLPAVADAGRVTQALLQLADNAVAVTHEADTIAFGCARVPGGNRLWVADSGPGVPEAAREEIFERFVSAHEGTGHRGSGLGLAIVLAIAQAHGGHAWVTRSAQHGGAMFVLDLPTGPPTAYHPGEPV